jgi:putative redox protein
VQVTAESVREDEAPWRFRKIHIRYTFTGRELNEKAIQQAIELTETKYCSTYATLREAVELFSDYEIFELTGGKYAIG